MALNASGAISLAGTTTGQSIELELGGDGTTQISFNDSNVRSLLGISSGAISLFSAYGVSNLPSFAPFAGGTIAGGSTKLNTVDLYSFTSDTSTTGTNLPYLTYYCQGTGNNTKFLHRQYGAAGVSQTATNFYSYSALSWSTGTSLTGGPDPYGGLISNKTVAIAKGNGLTSTMKYTYSSDTVAAGGTLTYNGGGPCCLGNSTRGVFIGGQAPSTQTFKVSSKYNYSDDTTSSGGSYSRSSYTTGVYFCAGMGNPSVGYMCGGADQYTIYGSAETTAYTYSADTTAAGTNLQSAVAYQFGGGSATAGIQSAGFTNLQSQGVFILTSSKYTYATNVVTAGGNISQARAEGAGPGVSPASI